MALTVTSQAFKNGESIPSKYTCDGEDISPPLRWSDALKATRTYVLMLNDSDSPMAAFTHWVIFNIPASESGLQENIPKTGTLPNGAIQGRNDFVSIGYRGPCPLFSGTTRRYVFLLYALDIQLNFSAGTSKQDILNAIESHILAKAELTGMYNRL